VKKRLRQFLKRRDLEEIANLAVRKRRVLSTLVSLTFDPEPLISWRAVEAMGAAAESIAHNDPDGVVDHLRRLYWLMSEESGGICWRSPEAMAEIVRRRPDQFGDYVPVVVSLIREMADEDLNHFRPGILWAIGRLGPIAEKELAAVLPTIEACLDHPDPQVRGMAAWCLGQCGHGELLADRDELVADEASVALYEDGLLVQTSVGELVRRSAQKSNR
jgi:methylated-DNA-[protein]-cysteine S-methyltransferase